ncbi:hypothetical protein PROFUN_08730 [Planoprotostelium fungivorum]|uniref:Uncharacterized protein n=1 Tax=Planoprotostelium fungivorum TaxID=1890364 RepID=A0A2P6ND23_9EUKA|nr:hypothetical protein PROFUN_08730 [Planoprotostelium fungivorum]
MATDAKKLEALSMLKERVLKRIKCLAPGTSQSIIESMNRDLSKIEGELTRLYTSKEATPVRRPLSDISNTHQSHKQIKSTFKSRPIEPPPSPIYCNESQTSTRDTTVPLELDLSHHDQNDSHFDHSSHDLARERNRSSISSPRISSFTPSSSNTITSLPSKSTQHAAELEGGLHRLLRGLCRMHDTNTAHTSPSPTPTIRSLTTPPKPTITRDMSTPDISPDRLSDCTTDSSDTSFASNHDVFHSAKETEMKIKYSHPSPSRLPRPSFLSGGKLTDDLVVEEQDWMSQEMRETSDFALIEEQLLWEEFQTSDASDSIRLDEDDGDEMKEGRERREDDLDLLFEEWENDEFTECTTPAMDRYKVDCTNPSPVKREPVTPIRSKTSSSTRALKSTPTPVSMAPSPELIRLIEDEVVSNAIILPPRSYVDHRRTSRRDSPIPIQRQPQRDTMTSPDVQNSRPNRQVTPEMKQLGSFFVDWLSDRVQRGPIFVPKSKLLRRLFTHKMKATALLLLFAPLIVYSQLPSAAELDLAFADWAKTYGFQGDMTAGRANFEASIQSQLNSPPGAEYDVNIFSGISKAEFNAGYLGLIAPEVPVVAEAVAAGLSTGAIVGIAVGGAVALALVAGGVFAVVKYRQKKNREDQTDINMRNLASRQAVTSPTPAPAPAPQATQTSQEGGYVDLLSPKDRHQSITARSPGFEFTQQ